MTRSQVDQIIERLDKIEVELATIRMEMAETRGAYRLAKWIVGLLGLTGLSSLAAWFATNGANK